MNAMLNKFNSIIAILLFIWISFFPDLKQEHFLWMAYILSFLFLLLLIIFKNGLKDAFNFQNWTFWLFILTSTAGLIKPQEGAVVYWHFWRFMFPIPFLYFFTKTGFEKKFGIILIRIMIGVASLVAILGMLEFFNSRDFIYSNLTFSPYYEAFRGVRIMSTQIHPTPLGTYFVAIFPLAAMLLFLEKRLSYRLMAFVCAVVIFAGCVLTFSRGVLLGLLAGIFTMAVFLLRKKKAVFIVAIVLFLIVAISSLLFSCGYFPFIRYSLTGLSADDAIQAKIYRFVMLGRILKDHPFIGVGFGRYRVLFDHYLTDLPVYLQTNYSGKVADNMFVTILAETGLVGFGGFFIFIFFLFKRIKLAIKLSSGNRKLFLVYFLSGFIGIMCAFLTYDGLYWTTPSCLFWGYAGFLAYLSIKPGIENNE